MSATKKSGLRRMGQGEVLFNDGDKAESLYIIQKGQLRLYKPKGRGFVEIAVLRAGEVIGEMAYFDDDGGGKRSCSASAMLASEVIEISFAAFGKTMESLNPWFKTIINTLANRLRATNSRVKELESNSAGVNYSTGKHADYEFLKSNEVIKILGMIFLIWKAHGENASSGGVAVHRRTVDLYLKDVFGVIETKFDGLLFLLTDLGLATAENDKDGLPKMIVMKSLDNIRQIFVFFNTEKMLPDEKKLVVEERCQQFLEKIYASAVNDVDDRAEKILFGIQPIIDDFKHRNIPIGIQNLDDAKTAGIVGEIIIGKKNDLNIELFFTKLKQLLPIIRFKNTLKKLNMEKQKG